jgi:hypothetical protein
MESGKKGLIGYVRGLETLGLREARRGRYIVQADLVGLHLLANLGRQSGMGKLVAETGHKSLSEDQGG